MLTKQIYRVGGREGGSGELRESRRERGHEMLETER